MDKFAQWLKFSEKTPPIGYILREKFPSCWFRIHSLPEAKRYPDSDMEIRAIQERHLKVAKEVLGDGTVSIFLGLFSEKNETSNTPDILKGIDLVFADSFNVAEEDDEPYYLNIHAGEINLDDKIFLNVIKAVALGNLGSVLFFSQAKLNVYAPYDGGADIFILGSDDMLTLKLKFASWLSRRKDGL